jgi:hypothetical protein
LPRSPCVTDALAVRQQAFKVVNVFVSEPDHYEDIDPH